jgi:hypothetical protein
MNQKKEREKKGVELTSFISMRMNGKDECWRCWPSMGDNFVENVDTRRLPWNRMRKKISPNFWRKYVLAFLTQNTAIYGEKVIITLVLKRFDNFFSENW